MLAAFFPDVLATFVKFKIRSSNDLTGSALRRVKTARSPSEGSPSQLIVIALSAWKVYEQEAS